MNPPATPRTRLAARFSIMAAFACFAMNCVANRILFQLPGHARFWDWLLGAVSSGCVLAGIVLGVIGLIGGLREKNSDTAMIAVIGLTLNTGIVAVTIWMLMVIWG